MRKSLNFMTWAFVALMMVATSACSSNDDEKKEHEKEEEKGTIRIGYAIPPLYDLLSICDVKVSYKDANGNMMEKVITTSPDMIVVEDILKPFKAEMTVTATKKAGFTPSKDSYTMGGGFGIATGLSSGSFTGGGAVSKSIVQSSRLDQYLSKNYPYEHQKDF